MMGFGCLPVSNALIFGSEHQVLAKQLVETSDPCLKKDFEEELSELVEKMEQKGEQIATVRRHRALLEENRRNKGTGGDKMQRMSMISNLILNKVVDY